MSRVANTAQITHISELPRRRALAVLGGVLLGIMLAALDQTIVGTAMPRVIAQLQGLDRYAWVFTAYMLTSTVSMPIWGKLSDLYGRKWFFMGSMALFVMGSMLSGAAQTMNQLIVFRAVQGLGAGAMQPIAQAIIGDIFPPAERGKYQGFTGGAFGLASVIGPALGGYITDAWNWRWVFYINLPVGVAALAAVYWTLPNIHPEAGQRRQIDYAGAALLVVGMVPLLLALTWAGSTYAWTSPQVLGLLLFAAVVLSAFLWVERHAPEPMLPLSLLRNDIVRVSAIASFLAVSAMFGVILYIGLFVQGVLGQSATASGAVVTPMMLGLVAGSIISGQLVSRWGHYRSIAVVGLALAAVGVFRLARMDTGTSLATVVQNVVIFGAGMGTGLVLFTIVVQNAVEYRLLGVATAAMAFFRALGGTLGTAVLGSLLTATFHREFAARTPETLRAALPAEALARLEPEALLNAEAMAQLEALFAGLGPNGEALLVQLLDAIRGALAVALQNVFITGTVVMALAAVTCMLLREIPLRRSVRGVEVPAVGD